MQEGFYPHPKKTVLLCCQIDNVLFVFSRYYSSPGNHPTRFTGDGSPKLRINLCNDNRQFLVSSDTIVSNSFDHQVATRLVPNWRSTEIVPMIRMHINVIGRFRNYRQMQMLITLNRTKSVGGNRPRCQSRL